MSNLKAVAMTFLYHCPRCGSKGFLREKDGRCSFCSGRENGECIRCGEPCLDAECEWCGADQSLPSEEKVNYTAGDIDFVTKSGQKALHE